MSSADYVPAIAGVEFGPTGATIPDDLGQEDWTEALRRLGSDAAHSWRVGDLLAFGGRRYGDGSYELAASVLGLASSASARNLASVSRRVGPAQRRPALPWRAHREVAKFSVKEQDRWLDRAEAEGWTSDQLAAAIREPHRPPRPAPEETCLPNDGEVEVVRDLPTGQNGDLDAAAHWEAAGAPSYEEQEPPFKVIVNCESEDDRDDLLAYLGEPTIHNRNGRTSSVWWPDRPTDDVASVEFVEAVAA